MASGLVLAGCTTLGGPSLGVNAGSSAQPQTLKTDNLLGALDGGLVGRVVGLPLRGRQKLEPLRAEYRALEYTAPGQPVLWETGTAGITGAVTASQPYRVGSQDCRQYAQVINGKSEPVEIRGTACRNEDGSWSLLN